MAIAKTFPWLAKPLEYLNRMREKQPSSILIHGARGSGSFEVATAYARSLLCTSPENGEACGMCAECRLVEAGNHPDFKLVLSEAESAIHPEPWAEPVKVTAKKSLSRNISIEQIREIGEFLSLNPLRGGKKVVLVYPADMMMADQSSALLKTLEEPPPSSVLILVSDNLESMLPTIKSRCQLVRIPPPTKEEGIAFLKSQGVRKPEEELAKFGGLPLLYFEEDAKLTLDPEKEQKVLALVSKGPGLGSGEIIKATSEEFAILPLTVLMQRWVTDVILAGSGLNPRYFLRYSEQSAAIGRQVSLKAMYGYLDELQKIKRSSSIALNARIISQDILFAYAKACHAPRR